MHDWQTHQKFLGITGPKSEPEGSKYMVLPVPFERTTSYKPGTRFGPLSIVQASMQVELWDEELEQETWKKTGIATAEPLSLVVDSEQFFERLRDRVGQIVDGGHFPIILGGEHAITPSCVEAVAQRHAGLSVLQIDAHADLREEYEGTRYSHACAMKRVLDHDVPVVACGIRSISEDERAVQDAPRVTTFLAHKERDVEVLIPKLLEALSDTVYITLDADGMDPSVMPGTGTPVPGGFDWYETLAILEAVCREKTVVGFDLVEVLPLADTDITEFNAAKLCYRLIGYHSR